MWATKVSNAVEKDEIKQKLDTELHEEAGTESFSGDGAHLDIKQSDSTMRMMTEHGSLNALIENQEKLSLAFEKLASDLTTRTKMMDEDMKWLKVDLKNSLEIQKDTVKSYLCVKKDIADMKGKFEMAYGKKFFHQRN